MFERLMKILRISEHETVRETIEDLIEEHEEEDTSIQDDERQLLGNILNLRELTAKDVMLPRADIVAVDDQTDVDKLIQLMVEHGFSCIPIYHNNLDNIIGTVHIKDILSFLNKKTPLKLQHLMKKNIQGISPSMHALDLLLAMRKTGQHRAIVADEHGGTDGMVCFSDIIEAIVGDIQDVYHTEPKLLEIKKNGSIIADARISLEELSENLQVSLQLDKDFANDDIDTLGGLIAAITNRVPIIGEVIKCKEDLEFQILDADLRRVKKVLIMNVQSKNTAN
jgi:magnesium and cobalt transporter